MLKHTDNLSVNFSGLKHYLPTFRTKKEAIDAGKPFGWRTAVRFEDRFEKGWMVGKRMLGNETIAGVTQAQYKLPALKWEKNNGVEFCPVITVLKVLI